MEELNTLYEGIEPVEKAVQKIEELGIFLELARDEMDLYLAREVDEKILILQQKIEELTIRELLNEKHDRNNAILSIHPGAGGTESKDWAQMLMRMYLRWAEKKEYVIQILDYIPEEQAGLNSVTMLVKGLYAYGYLKGEKGVHRLVRISPFDANKRRHTSFASIWVMPEIDNQIEVKITDEDLKIDTFRSSGPGGQHVNVTDSAIRITHLPTKIVVSCQNERSQYKNKANALKVLRSRLFEYYQEEHLQKMKKLSGNKDQIAWGSQIRSYVFQPYTLIKDHRTQVEIGDGQKVMDGYLEPFIEAYLRMKNR